VFRAENQGCCFWTIDLSDTNAEDPPVICYRREFDAGQSRLTNGRQDADEFSGFAIFSLLYESMWRPPVAGTAYQHPGEPDVLERLRPNLEKCDLPTRYWGMDPIFVYEGEEIFVVESVVDGYIYLSARTDVAFSQMCEGISCEVDRENSSCPSGTIVDPKSWVS